MVKMSCKTKIKISITIAYKMSFFDEIDDNVIGQPFVKRLPYAIGPLSVCPVCDLGVLWPNGWTDEDETWHTGRPWSWPHCVSWGPSSPFPKRHRPQFLAHVCCGQTAGWIKMPLGIELGLGPGHIVPNGDPAPPPPKGHSPQFSSVSVLAKWLDGSRCHLVGR